MVDKHDETESSDSPHIDARARILDAAEELFGSRGFEAVSVSEIASAAGVSTALIYYHFQDKQSLLLDIMFRGGEMFEPLQDALRNSTGSARDRLAAYIDSWITGVLDRENLVRILVRPLLETSAPLGNEILVRVSRNMEAIADVIAEGMDNGEFAPGDPILAAECLFALLNTRAAAGVLNASHLERVSRDPHDIARFISDVYLGGLTIGAGGKADAC